MAFEGEHAALALEALELEAEGQRLLLAGDERGGRERMLAAMPVWRRSWEAAPPRSYGRLIGLVKAAVIGGDAVGAAEYVRGCVEAPDSPPAAYALALAALALGDDADAAELAEHMRGASPAFERAADAIVALAAHDAQRYAVAAQAIVEDFEGRDEHLTGVAIADTALVLERLAERRGIAARPVSALMPPVV